MISLHRAYSVYSRMGLACIFIISCTNITDWLVTFSHRSCFGHVAIFVSMCMLLYLWYCTNLFLCCFWPWCCRESNGHLLYLCWKGRMCIPQPCRILISSFSQFWTLHLSAIANFKHLQVVELLSCRMPHSTCSALTFLSPFVKRVSLRLSPLSEDVLEVRGLRLSLSV